MVLDATLGWVLAYDLWVSILILAFLITLVMNIVYKFATDQDEMKRLKKRLKNLQAKMKEHRDNPKKAMSLQKKMMSVNGQYMKKSLKPTIYTLVPLLFVFGWMASSFALAPVMPGQTVDVSVELEEPSFVTLSAQGVDVLSQAEQETVERVASWEVSAPQAGEYTLEFSTRDNGSAQTSFVVGSVAETGVSALDEPFVEAEVSYGKATPFGDFSIFGYRPGWLATYILFSVVLSVLMRKAMKLS